MLSELFNLLIDNYQRLQDQFISYLPSFFHSIRERFNSIRFYTINEHLLKFVCFRLCV